ncbi:tail fiber domain-containing protein [Phaeovulum sp.]|uniref:tail fiber domain-containing protein n=1 Tax=Phaeovulum sp. TaxID=2934796 RepID=UPI003568C6C0
MRKLLLASAIAAVSATSAFAGGYVAPVVAPAPVVVEKRSSSSAGLWIPLALLVVVALIVANDDDPDLDASDIRLKTDITPVGTAMNGLPLYHFRYHGLPTVYEGVMAQDVLSRFPEAVVVGPGGLLSVNYRMLGLEMKVVH